MNSIFISSKRWWVVFLATFVLTLTGCGGGGGGSTYKPPTTPVNSNPIAFADTAEAVVGVQLTISPLENDTDPNGDALSLSSVGTPSNGGTAEKSGNSVLYTAANAGTETITYTVSDGRGGSDTGTITVTVSAVLTAINDSSTIYVNNGTLVVDVRENDIIPDETTELSISTEPENGNVTIDSEGRLAFTAVDNFYGNVVVGYTLTAPDGTTASASLSITVIPFFSVARSTCVPGSYEPLVFDSTFDGSSVKIGGDYGLSLVTPDGVLPLADQANDGQPISLQREITFGDDLSGYSVQCNSDATGNLILTLSFGEGGNENYQEIDMAVDEESSYGVEITLAPVILTDAETQITIFDVFMEADFTTLIFSGFTGITGVTIDGEAVEVGDGETFSLSFDENDGRVEITSAPSETFTLVEYTAQAEEGGEVFNFYVGQSYTLSAEVEAISLRDTGMATNPDTGFYARYGIKLNQDLEGLEAPYIFCGFALNSRVNYPIWYMSPGAGTTGQVTTLTLGGIYAGLHLLTGEDKEIKLGQESLFEIHWQTGAENPVPELDIAGVCINDTIIQLSTD